MKGSSEWKRADGDGNSVAAYQYRWWVCRKCRGDGEIEVSFDEYNAFVLAHCFDSKDYHKKVKKQWRETGTIECPECGGEGQGEEWR